jgi:Fic family protein
LSISIPFNDGNGRTARLLMNLILIRGGYPPVAVRPEDRPTYLQTLQTARGTEKLLYQRLDATLLDATLTEVLTSLHDAIEARS